MGTEHLLLGILAEEDGLGAHILRRQGLDRERLRRLVVRRCGLGAPGVPGGTVMASLGLITGVLGFDETGTALMLTIFALQDSFGTACNVTGDGALTLFLTGYARKHGIKEADPGSIRWE